MTYAETILADSPTAYWRFGEASGSTADNAEGTAARDGTYQGSPTLGVAGAIADDTAVTLDGGTTQRVTTAVSTPGDTFTVEVWFKRAATGATHTLFRTTNSYLNVYISGANLVAADNGTALFFRSTETVTDTAGWHHLVLTKNGATRAAYLDGTALTNDRTDATVSADTNLCIGGRTGGGTYGWNGSLDEAAIYSTALTSEQVTAHFDASANPILATPDLVATTTTLFVPAIATTTKPGWTSPADGSGMSSQPELKFVVPISANPQHFYLELDTAATFDTANLRTYRSDQDQTDWTFWDGNSWEPVPVGGVTTTYIGNEARLTVTDPLDPGTWYRRVRASL